MKCLYLTIIIELDSTNCKMQLYYKIVDKFVNISDIINRITIKERQIIYMFEL